MTLGCIGGATIGGGPIMRDGGGDPKAAGAGQGGGCPAVRRGLGCYGEAGLCEGWWGSG